VPAAAAVVHAFGRRAYPEYPLRTTPSYYTLSLLAAVAGSAFSTRQILLHILTGNSGQSSALLDYHHDTRALIASLWPSSCSPPSCCYRQFEGDGAARPISAGASAHATVWLVIGLTELNVASTLLECGLGGLRRQSSGLRTDETRA
jgi:hypothetical protein